MASWAPPERDVDWDRYEEPLLVWVPRDEEESAEPWDYDPEAMEP